MSSLVRIVVLVAVFGAAHAEGADAPVTLAQDASAFTMDNGIVTVRVEKRSGTFSVRYRNIEVIERGYWSQVGRSSAGDIGPFGSDRTSAVRTDPATNAGARAEIACRFAYVGKSAGLPCDVEMRYALGRGESGVYAYAVFEHKPGQPGFSVGEGRMALKLDPKVLNYLAIDEKRRMELPSGADWDKGETLNMKEVRRIRTGPLAGRIEHKYDYSAILADTPAYGWIGTRDGVGVWMINPGIEYLAGGPTKVELTGHLDVNPGGAPVLLNMWHGSHYGGSSLVVAETEAWTKLIGPFLIYCNSAAGPDAMWQDAQAKARAERQAWPYDWVADPAYPLRSERGAVSGALVVSDPQAPDLKISNLHVGLASPPYSAGGRERGAFAVDWQRDSKHYQFWTVADSAGKFTISDVRPGAYTLYAFGDGVLGEFSKAEVTVAAGKTNDVGALKWQPVRYGRQLWEIGVPDRSAAEFRHGDDYWHWGLYYDYAREFPRDVNFIVGKSDWHKDWNFVQPPRIEGSRVMPSTWSIRFDLPEAPHGKATLRLGIAGSRLRGGIAVTVNGKSAGDTGPLPDTGVMHRDGIRGYWVERDVPFDAALLNAGTNVLQLTPPASSWVNGVLYDYLRLELDDTAKPPG